jgi:endonuclease/exonuclease/phosphatase family metal-dependent hydrolase
MQAPLVHKPKVIKKLAYSYFFLCCVFCLLVTALPYWPTYELLIIPKYALLFGPRWWLLVCVMCLYFFWRDLSKRQLQFSVLLVLLSLNYLDFQWPTMVSYFSASASSSTVQELSVLTANIGGGGSDRELDYISFTKHPDIILLQEARKIQLSTLFNDYHFKECLSGLCIFSQYPFERVNTLNRKLFEGWGIFAIFYQVNTPFGVISLANVHFETPRSVLMGLIHRYWDFELASTIESNRQFEAELVSLGSTNKRHTLIVGDFNMPQDENIYQRNFSHLNNAVDNKAFGFNATKLTSWHGVRIDHILYSDDFKLKFVEVVDSIKGDHRPVLATFNVR